MHGLYRELAPGGGIEAGRAEEAEGEACPGGPYRGPTKESRGRGAWGQGEGWVAYPCSSESFRGVFLERLRTSTVSQPLRYKQDKLWRRSHLARHVCRGDGW